jgi:hypothetical protein
MDPLVAHQRAQDIFTHVLVNVTSDQLSAPTPCPEWDVKALIDHVIELRISDLLTHAWDLATATRQPTDLDPELAEYVLAFSKQMMSRPGLRGDGRPFGQERPCGDARPAADRVAAFLGRELS